jgi:hypothetical protein
MRAYKSVRRLLASLIYEITAPEKEGWMSVDCLAALDSSPSGGSTPPRSPRVSTPGDSHYTGSSPRGWHVYFTGHSLGGALATLTAYELSIYKYGSRHTGTRSASRLKPRLCRTSPLRTMRHDADGAHLPLKGSQGNERANGLQCDFHQPPAFDK